MLLLKRMMISLILVIGLSSVATAAELIDINKASATELSEGLNGIGEQKAAEIVAYRKAHGSFKSVDDLQNVKGIGAATVDKLRKQLTIGVSPKAGGKPE